MTATEVRHRMPLGSLVPIVAVEGLCLVAVFTGIGGNRKSNAKSALPAPSVGLNITLGIAALLLVAVIVRTVRLRIVLRPAELEIRNLWRTHRLAWDDIVSAAPPRFGHLRKAGLLVTTRNGRVISASAFLQGLLDVSDRGRQVTAEIAERIAATTASLNRPPG